MSLHIIKAGLLDTVQDMGRYGYQHLGINPNGAMDRYAAQLANALLGKNVKAPVLEMHFPAPTLLFQKDTLICLTGADFSPVLNDAPLPLHRPVAVAANSRLAFTKWVSGARCYLSLWQDWEMEKWLNSYSTHLKAGAGGWQGRALQSGDEIPYQEDEGVTRLLNGSAFVPLPWQEPVPVPGNSTIECLYGAEWNWLEVEAWNLFQHQAFYISHQADRMGYRLSGIPLKTHIDTPLLSSGVAFGTVQLLPDGQLVILMADHQTTGGYPKIAQVISAHLPLLAQRKPGEAVRFQFTDLALAEQRLVGQQKYLEHLQNACKLKLQNLL